LANDSLKFVNMQTIL